MAKFSRQENIGFMALRISVGLIFVVLGWGKLNGIDGVAGMLEGMGFPAAGFMAWLLALVEFLGGLALILGVYIRMFAKMLAIAMLVALFTAHVPGPFKEAFSAIALLGSSIAVAYLGGGDWQLLQGKECFSWCTMCKCKPKK